jgi:hypothetical protein
VGQVLPGELDILVQKSCIEEACPPSAVYPLDHQTIARRFRGIVLIPGRAGLPQSLGKEFSEKGVHVCHVIANGVIEEDPGGVGGEAVSLVDAGFVDERVGYSAGDGEVVMYVSNSEAPAGNKRSVNNSAHSLPLEYFPYERLLFLQSSSHWDRCSTCASIAWS